MGMKLQEFIDANPWLEKCKSDINTRTSLPSFWWDESDEYLYTKHYIDLHFPENTSQIRVLNDGEKVKVESHFINWKSPTKEENEIFEMLYGRPLPWSEEQPFIWEE